MSTSKKDNRTRNWLFIAYPESMPENWRTILDSFHIEVVVSPLHDKDINEADQEQKKAHYHVLLIFPSVKCDEQIKKLIAPLNATMPIACQSVKGTVRYFLHLDNPEKFQYNKEDLTCFGGVDLVELLQPTASEVAKIRADLCRFIKDNGITEYCDLIELLLGYREDWFNVACTQTIFFNGYITSRRNRAHCARHAEYNGKLTTHNIANLSI